MDKWKPWQNCLALLGIFAAGWLLIILIGYAILRGILSFMALYDHD